MKEGCCDRGHIRNRTTTKESSQKKKKKSLMVDCSTILFQTGLFQTIDCPVLSSKSAICGLFISTDFSEFAVKCLVNYMTCQAFI